MTDDALRAERDALRLALETALRLIARECWDIPPAILALYALVGMNAPGEGEKE